LRFDGAQRPARTLLSRSFCSRRRAAFAAPHSNTERSTTAIAMQLRAHAPSTTVRSATANSARDQPPRKHDRGSDESEAA
jgi:hypothetical protein